MRRTIGGWQKWKYAITRKLFLLSVQAFMLSRTAYFSVLKRAKVLNGGGT